MDDAIPGRLHGGRYYLASICGPAPSLYLIAQRFGILEGRVLVGAAEYLIGIVVNG